MIDRQYAPGMVVTEPGIYANVPIDVYHGQDWLDGPSISSSGLRKIASESPAHFFCEWSGNPEREPQSASRALILGQAAHHLLLGEDHFSTRFIMQPEELDGEPWQGNRKACRAWLGAQSVAGRIVIKADEIKTIRGMAKSLGAHPLIQHGLLNGRVERSMVWRCKDTGLWKKARPDVLPNDSGMFVDLKTTAAVFDDDVRKSIFEFGYHQQGALICEGWATLTGQKDTVFSLVFVEKSAPFCCRVITLTDEDLARGERQNFAAMDVFAQCLDASQWPGPGKYDGEYMHIPQWAADRIDRRLEQYTKEKEAA